MLFLCECRGKDGTHIITGASKFKLNHYPELELTINEGRVNRFTKSESEKIKKYINENRAAAIEVQETDAFKKMMSIELEQLASAQEDEKRANQQLKTNQDEKSRKIKEYVAQAGKATSKDKKAAIQTIRHSFNALIEISKKEIKDAQEKARSVRQELLGAARKKVKESAEPQDYFNHSGERGMAVTPHNLTEANPCWSC